MKSQENIPSPKDNNSPIIELKGMEFKGMEFCNLAKFKKAVLKKLKRATRKLRQFNKVLKKYRFKMSYLPKNQKS